MENRQLTLILFTTVLLVVSLISARIDSSFNIPKNVKPLRYTLTIETMLEVSNERSTFNGSIIIELFSSQVASNITLHSRMLDINNSTIQVIHSSGSEITVSSTEIDDEKEFYIIHLEDELLANEYYNLTIKEFSGVMKYDSIGFYLAKYTNKDGEER